MRKIPDQLTNENPQKIFWKQNVVLSINNSAFIVDDDDHCVIFVFFTLRSNIHTHNMHNE